MTDKEKAKRYDEAIERARALNNGEDVDVEVGTTTCEYIFPELKESEDERIRKELIDFVKSRLAGFPECSRFIAWLEKQDKKDKLIKELGEYKVKYTQEVIEKHINSRSNKDDERLRKTTIAFLKDFAEQGYENAVECIDWLKKQDERKPTDKVKPKFNVGDWVIDKQNIVHQIANVIENVTNHTYGYDIVGGGYFNDNTEGVRLWTIQDAKNGDVLVCDINKAEIGGDVEKLPNTVSTIFIFKNVVSSRDYIHSYCHLYDRHVLGVQNTMYYNSFVYNIHPATKEQRDILFQKVEEAGYNWDSDKVAQSSIKEIGYDKEI